jgi:hypothetical protein
MPQWLQRLSKNRSSTEVPAASTAGSSSTPPRKIFPSGIKLLHNPEKGVVEYVNSLITWYNCRLLAPTSKPCLGLPRLCYCVYVQYSHFLFYYSIVFVHGLTGDRERTWRAKSATAPWPQSLLPSRVHDARILTFGYDAYVSDWRGVVSNNRIGNHSMNLLTSVATYREDDGTVSIDRLNCFCNALNINRITAP